MDNKDPFFIIGSHRSGTSMLSHILATSHGFNIIYESGIIYKVIEEYGLHRMIEAKKSQEMMRNLYRRILEPATIAGVNLEYSFKDIDIPIGEISSCFSANMPAKVFLKRAYYFLIKNLGCKILGEKDPGYRFFMKEISQMFPESKIIYIVRHPYDTILSYKHHGFEGGKNLVYHPIITPMLWRNGIKQYINWSKKNPKRSLIVRFEDLIDSNKDRILKHICSFLGVEFNSDTPLIKGENSSFKNQEKPNLTNVERYYINKFCKQAMNEFGYKYKEEKIPFYIYMKTFFSLIPFSFVAFHAMKNVHFNIIKFFRVRLRSN